MMVQSHQDRLLTLAGRLDEYARHYERQRDSRAVFSLTYALITRTLANGINEMGFNNPDWVTSLAEAFARHYVSALNVFDQGGNPPKVWAEVFRVLKMQTTSVLEDLVYAMTAHIVHDLPLALLDVGLEDVQQVSHIRDFHRMNDILGNNIKEIEDKVLSRYEPAFKWLDHLERGYDQILTNYGFRLSRGMAWYNAVRLLDPTSLVEAKASIERSAVQLIDNVRNPRFIPLRIAFRGLRFIAALLRRWPVSKECLVKTSTVRRNQLKQHHQRFDVLNMTTNNEIYYYEVGKGEWTGEFWFGVTNWSEFWKSKIRFSNRFLILAMALTIKLLKRGYIHSRISAFPDAGAAGIASNSYLVYRLGLTLFLSNEDYILDPNGSNVVVKAKERFGPIPFLFHDYVEYPATIHEGGMSSTYYLPMLDSRWVAQYQVREDRNQVFGVLECNWGRAEEIMNRKA